MSALRAVDPEAPAQPTIAWLRTVPTVTVPVAAAALGIGRNTYYELIHRGEVPFLKLGNRYVVPTAKLLRLLEVSDA